MKRKQTSAAPPEPFSGADHATMQDMDLTVMQYRNTCTPPDAEGKRYWLPRIVAGADLALIVWRESGEGNYSTGGWEPQLGPHTFGGRYAIFAAALRWLQCARDVRDGKARDFLGA